MRKDKKEREAGRKKGELKNSEGRSREEGGHEKWNREQRGCERQ